jgi:2-alkenal reductase
VTISRAPSQGSPTGGLALNYQMWHLFAGIGLIIALIFGTGTRTAAQNATPVSDTAQTPINVVRQVGPAVVTVINLQRVSSTADATGSPSPATSQVEPVGSGSGFIIDDQGHIVTNNHVVAGGVAFDVIFADGTKLEDAKLIGADPVSDLAVIQVSDTVPATVAFGDSSQLEAGETVLAIGSPLGSFSNTVTEGIIGGLGRSLPTQPGGSVYTNLIQHDAPINPGNSGGPLFNLQGQVVGVNTIGIPQAEQDVPAQGLFFAIPSNTVQTIVQQLIATGKVVYPSLGLQNPVALDPELAAVGDLPVAEGVFVSDVEEGGPAAAAGIVTGDVILAIDGQPIDEQHSWEELLFMHKPGETVQVTIQRGQQQLQVAVKLATRPAPSMACPETTDCSVDAE